MQQEEEKTEEKIIENQIDNNTFVNQNQKWQTLTEKVYELELLISGAGIYLFSTLFHSLDWVWQYYNYNFLDIENDTFITTLAGIVYLISKGSSLVLWIGFILHFVLRAFWITMIGMMNLFPKGIIYEKLPKKYSKEYIEYLKEKIPPTEKFIIAIDRTCSAILFVAFLFVLMLVTGASMYVLVIFGYDILKMFFGANKDSLDLFYLSLISFFLFGLFVPFLIGFIFVFLKRDKKFPLKIELYHASRNYWFFGSIIQRLGFIVRTNVYHNFMSYAGVCIVLIFIISMIIYRNYQKAERQYFFNQISGEYLNVDNYENLRHNEKYVKKASIQQDVITQPLIKLFLAYPKELETHIENKKLLENEDKKQAKNKAEKEKLLLEKQKKMITFWQSFFKIYLNDSLCNTPDLVLQQHPRTLAKGFGVYLHPKNLKHGKNLLRVNVPKIKINSNSTKKQQENNELLWIEIPFWYFP